MDRLINDLLDYSRVGRIEPTLEVTDLGMIVAEALHDLTQEIKSRNADVFVQHPLPSVLGNKATLLHVVANLLSNALKFTQHGVKPEVKIFAERRGNFVRLTFHDNGIGIAEEHRERIFRIFERLHGSETYPGTGVGLAIVKKAVERLGGRTGVESEPGNGSSFWFELRSPE
jgi:signal transduction histidine kinase